jgi:hypothetical protein
MSLDPTWLFVSLFPSGIGFVLFVYGKKQERWLHLATGLALMVYPYFTSGTLSLLLVGGIICLAFWCALRLGW